jgi:hypothetical protein
MDLSIIFTTLAKKESAKVDGFGSLVLDTLGQE